MESNRGNLGNFVIIMGKKRTSIVEGATIDDKNPEKLNDLGITIVVDDLQLSSIILFNSKI